MDIALVTGGAGFLGSHIAEVLCQQGTPVVVLDNLSGGFRRNVPVQAEFVPGDLTDAQLIDALFARSRFTHVYHCAAYAAEGLSHFIRRFNYTNNVLGSCTLINAAINHQVACFVFTSSMAVYGDGQVPFTEGAVPQPEDPYGIAKLAIEQDLRVAAKLFGLNAIVFRPHNLYGERQNLADPYRNVVAIFMKQVLAGRPCTVFGDGQQMRAFSYVGDVAPLIARSVCHPAAYGQVFNIGADQPHTILQLAELVQQVLGRRVGIDHLPARNEVESAWCDHRKVRQTFGWQAAVELDEGLRCMARWAETLEIGPSRLMHHRIEVSRMLPPSWAALVEAISDERRGAGD
jgi:UDP-glucose 4-epimerase